MRSYVLTLTSFILLALYGCASVEKIAFHDLRDGYYKMKIPEKEPEKVYLRVAQDSVNIYPTVTGESGLSVNTSAPGVLRIDQITTGSEYYGSSFRKNSVDFDLSTVLLKYRPARGDVPNQLNANLNAALYVGFRRDFYRMITTRSPLNEESTFCRHLGFDCGIFAGFGITQINPTVTSGATMNEYDGVIFQKGFGAFITVERMSVGIVLGFDNLMDKNKEFWLYNQKPYLGLCIGIANF
jgi:hypothetical protein